MENEITVATFKEAVRGLDGPERTADLIVALVRERDDLKFLLLAQTEAHRLQLETVMTEREDLKDQVVALKAENKALETQLDDAEINYSKSVRAYMELEEENRKLREAWVQAPWPKPPSHVCSRECTPECTHD